MLNTPTVVTPLPEWVVFWVACPGGYVSLGLVHHPRKSLSEKHPKRGWSLGQFWHPIPGNHWTTLIFRPLTGIFFLACYILYYIQVLLPRWPFWPKRNKDKANSIVNNKPNCAGNIIPTAIGTRHPSVRAHRGIAPKCHTLSADACPGELWFWYPIFEISPFLIP